MMPTQNPAQETMQDPTVTPIKDVQPRAIGELDAVLEKLLSLHPNQSGFHLLKTGGDAFAARLAAIQFSKQTLDLQYYILQDDMTGKILVEEVLRAADRGVKVRLLLDDLDFRQARHSILILDAHDNIEIRIFNPAMTKRQRVLSKLFRLSRFCERYSKRMHNKALVADGKLAVVGGRNLGDEYFDARAEFAFNDLDVLTMGPVIEDVTAMIDAFWSAKPTHNLHDLGVKLPSERAISINRIALRRYYDEVAHLRIISHRRPLDMLNELAQGELTLSWAETEFLYDDPNKVLMPLNDADSSPMRRLEELLENANHEFVGVSPYFIPGEQGTRIMNSLVRRGITIRMLTNSLASTDISAVHAVYSRYRTRLLQQGVRLFELKPIPGKRTRHNLLRKGSSRSSLHAKVYVVDREWVMLGSMNLDPRSWRRNTESMVIMRNPSLADEVLEMFNEITAHSASYELSLKDAKCGTLEWRCEEQDEVKRFNTEPNPGWFRRICFYLFYHLAPEDQL